MATRRPFAHTERPQGSSAAYRPSALDALASLAKRGSSNIHAEQIQRPITEKPKMPTPVALQAMNRLGQGNMPWAGIGTPQTGQAIPRQQMPSLQMSAPLPQSVAPPEQPQQQPQEFQMPPVEGYWRNILEDIVKKNPAPKGQPDWRSEVLTKSKETRERLNKLREYIETLDRTAANV